MNDKLASAPSFQPLYGQIKALLVSSLASGEWKPGQMIPSESELASRFGVSQGTVRKAVDELATDRLLMRRQGRGTFVASHAEDRNSTRFLRLRAADGSAEPHVSRLIDCRAGKVTGRVAAALGIDPGAPVIEIRRVLAFAGLPVIHDHIVLPAPVFGGLEASTIEAWEGSMY
ncbi:MAG: GntR family transcriptional regulator, partial [Rhodocyclaceae bacterium]|nr:GntR family transcriptional regulator [Rhodocyclaceae bacterium]